MPLWNSEKTVKAKSKHELDFLLFGSLLLSFLKKVAGFAAEPQRSLNLDNTIVRSHYDDKDISRTALISASRSFLIAPLVTRSSNRVSI